MLAPEPSFAQLVDRIEALADWRISITPCRAPVMGGERWIVTGTNQVRYVQSFLEGLEHAEAYMRERAR